MYGETRAEDGDGAHSAPAGGAAGPRPGPILVERVVGGLLVLAAGLKVFELYDYPAEGIGRVITMIGAAIELLVGLALVLRVWSSVTVPAAAQLFVVLGTISMIGWGRDIARCDCMGPVPMSPGVMAILDLSALAALAWALVASGRVRLHYSPALAAALFVPGILGLMLGSILYEPNEPTARSLDQHLAVNRTVKLDPPRFRGRPFYLGKYITIDADLSRGRWKVILTRAGCPRCDRGVRAAGCRPEGDERVAVVWGGERTEAPLPAGCDAVVGHLAREKTWIFDAPATFHIVDGQVVAVR